ncbi:hypothetical protein SH2C18_48310 [Clostridium sediminicola]|uniref:leucine-rich repeat domain-containing protein n=1 Tax=Clostridium sediminicola TaxID=3114879 RepID=UPI0031F25267
MGEKSKQDYNKIILIYLVALLITLILYPFHVMNNVHFLMFLYWGIYGCQLLFFKKLIRKDLIFIIGIIILYAIFSFKLCIFARAEIMLGICFVMLISYYLFKVRAKYKWIKILSVMLLIPLTITISTHLRKNELIKDRVLEKRIKEMIKIENDISVEDLTLDNLKKIRRLHIWGDNNVYDLEGIEYCYNLEKLEVDCRGVKNLEAIGMLNNLKELYIYEENSYRLEKISGLESLDILRLSHVKINNGYSIKNFSGLKELELNEVKCKDLSFTKELKELEKLSLGGCAIGSLDGIQYLSNLKRLELNHTEVKNIDKIKELKSLEELELCKSEFGDVDKLQKETDFKISVREETYIDKILYKND